MHLMSGLEQKLENGPQLNSLPICLNSGLFNFKIENPLFLCLYVT